MKKRGRYVPDRKPPEHLVSATFDEPFDRFGITVLRWWYGEKSYEQSGSGMAFIPAYRQRVRYSDLEQMERHVWGCAPEIEPGHSIATGFGPEFWKQVATKRGF